MAEEGKDPKTAVGGLSQESSDAYVQASRQSADHKTEFEGHSQGNKNSEGVTLEGGIKPKTLRFDKMKTDVIRSPDGRFLIERARKSGKSILGRTRYVRSEDKNRALIWMYSYISHPPEKGTYVVLEFVESGKFIFACGQATAPRLCVGEPDGDLENPEDITTTADPRVFLMKPVGGSEVVFAWHDSINEIITLLPNSKEPVGLKPEGNGPTVEAQKFQLNLPVLRSKPGDESEAEQEKDVLEPVPYPFPFLPPGE